MPHRLVPARARAYVAQPIRRVALRGRITRPYWKRRFHRFGDYSILHRPDWVHAPHLISIGEATLIFHGLWLSVEVQAHGKQAPVISIGDRVGIRPYCTISAADSIVIEDDVIVSAFTTIIDSDHTFSRERPNVMHNPLATAPVRIGRGTWIGERCAILRGSRIGRQCAIGANSVVRGEIPDYSVAVGAPARVVGTTLD
jgi:acetyltransferase-like isoleucine patch superfamily enzyme